MNTTPDATVIASRADQPTTSRGLTFAEVARRLGCDVNQIRRNVRNEQIPVFRDGRPVRIPAAWVTAQPEYQRR